VTLSRTTKSRGRLRLQGQERKSPSPGWSDKRLVRSCLRGDEQAWSALIDKYKNLIYSVPIKYGASPEDAADVFQGVCLELFSELPHLREIAALRSWLITVAGRKYFHWMRSQRKRAGAEAETESKVVLPVLVEELEGEQMIREAVERLPRRCREMIRLLFYEHPALPYNQVAKRLGLATGSIGFIRRRCLQRLQQILEESGF